MNLSRQQVLEWVGKLTDKQFLEFFNESTEKRHLYSDEESYLKSRLILANATSLKKDDGENWEEWKLEILCTHDPKHYPSGFDDDGSFCQFGTCCNRTTVSYVKNALCSICGQAVYGT